MKWHFLRYLKSLFFLSIVNQSITTNTTSISYSHVWISWIQLDFIICRKDAIFLLILISYSYYLIICFQMIGAATTYLTILIQFEPYQDTKHANQTIYWLNDASFRTKWQWNICTPILKNHLRNKIITLLTATVAFYRYRKIIISYGLIYLCTI